MFGVLASVWLHLVSLPLQDPVLEIYDTSFLEIYGSRGGDRGASLL